MIVISCAICTVVMAVMSNAGASNDAGFKSYLPMRCPLCTESGGGKR